MSDNSVYVVCAVNSHSYNCALIFLSENNIPLSQAILIKIKNFSSQGGEWYAEFNAVSALGLMGKVLNFIKISSIDKLARSHKVYEFLNSRVDIRERSVVFIYGGYRDIPSLVAYCNLSNVKEVVLVDDGMVIFNTIKKRLVTSKPVDGDDAFSKYPVVSSLVRLLLKKINFCYPSIENITYFTRFPIKKYNLRKDRQLFSPAITLEAEVDSERVHFVSQPLVTLGIISAEKFKRALEFVSRKFDLVYYFPHRFETSLELELVESFENFRVVKIRSPYEEFLKSSDKLPGAVITFYSSVLYTLYSLPDLCKFFYIKIDLASLEEKRREDVGEVIEHIERDQRFSRLMTI